MNREALAWCLKRLRRSDQTRAQLAEGLESRGFEEAAASEVLDWLEARKLLDDARTAERRADLLLNHRGMGLAAAEAELEKMGVDPLTREEVLSQAGDEVERALDLLRRKLRPGEGAPKAARILASRGFDEDAIREALSRLYPDLEF